MSQGAVAQARPLRASSGDERRPAGRWDRTQATYSDVADRRRGSAPLRQVAWLRAARSHPSRMSEIGSKRSPVRSDTGRPRSAARSNRMARSVAERERR